MHWKSFQHIASFPQGSERKGDRNGRCSSQMLKPEPVAFLQGAAYEELSYFILTTASHTQLQTLLLKLREMSHNTPISNILEHGVKPSPPL